MEKLKDVGWTFVPAGELEREGYDEPLLIPNLLRAIQRINKGIGDEEIRQVLNRLKFAGTGIEGSKQILRFYKEGVPIKLEKERVVSYVQLFDYDHLDSNEFIVSRQVVHDGRERRRMDIMLYVNGIPLVNIECKNPASISESWENAFRDIKKYEKDIPELYKYVQIGVAAESEIRYFPIVPWQEHPRVHEWREDDTDPMTATARMLSPATLLDIIRGYLFFRVELGNATKVMARYMQYRASKKAVNRVLATLEGREHKRRGLIWHWQGSGKTLTMLFAANELYHKRELENPTILFIVDRIGLEEQLYEEFNALDIKKPQLIGSIDELKELLAFDDYKGKRGIFITLIHKFRPDELNQLYEHLKELSERKETIMTRNDVVAFIDEGHRTQYGMLAVQMKELLKNAFFFALTGTPIHKRGRDTYREFSYPPEEPYLDRYFVADSIRDGFTVPIAYQPRLERLHLKRDMLEVFLEVVLDELPDTTREQVEEGVKKRLNPIILFLENPERIREVAKDIAEHFKHNVDGKFKAMVVASSRKACVHYKNELDKHLPPEYSEVVMSYTKEDEEPISSHYRNLKQRYSGMDIEDIRKEVKAKFKEEEFPKILIVTDMLLAGFDAPILQTMYLDKPLKEHGLLQAVARTNRPYRDVKEAGLIIDYVGILKRLKQALESYSESDVVGMLNGIDTIRAQFSSLVDELLGLFEGIPKEYDRDTILRAIEVITTDKNKEKEFVGSYRHLRKIFELLGPDQLKLERFEDYKWLSAIYIYYMKMVTQRPSEGYVEQYLEKTVKFVHKSTEIQSIESKMPIIQFDERYLRELEEKVKNRKEKAANILFTLNRVVLVDKQKGPIYESLAERVERLMELWRQHTEDYDRIYTEGASIVNEIQALSERQRRLGLSDMEYSLLLTLERRFGADEKLVERVRELTQSLSQHMFRGWQGQRAARKSVEREVRRFARRLGKGHGMTLEGIDELYAELIEGVKTYGS